MQTQDFGAANRAAIIAGVQGPVDSAAAAKRHIENARARALAILGDNWLLSPNYDFAANYHHDPRFKTSRTLARIHADAIHAGRI